MKMKIMGFLERLRHFYYLLKNEICVIASFLIFIYPNTEFGLKMRYLFCKYKLKENLGKGAKIFNFSTIYFDRKLKIGNFFTMQRNVTLAPGDCFGIIIGNNVGIGDSTYIRSGNHDYSSIEIPFIKQGHIAKKVFSASGEEASIIIEDDVWIGANCSILSGAKIGKGSIVSAGSVIASEFPEYSIIVGNPGRVVGSRKNISFSKKYFQFP